METILAISCKLITQDNQVAKLEATLVNFAAACNWINQSVDSKLTNNVHIQSLVYKQVRQQFDLSANLAIRAINRVAGNRKTAKQTGKPVKDFKPTSVGGCISKPARRFRTILFLGTSGSRAT